MYFHPLSWHCESNIIEAYGWVAQDLTDLEYRTASLTIKGFTPYVYIKLPATIRWHEENVGALVRALKRIPYAPIFKTQLQVAQGIYSNCLQPKHNYLFVAFLNEKARSTCVSALKYPIDVLGIGKLRLSAYENKASPILQMTCAREISTAGWFYFEGTRVAERGTSCDEELETQWKTLRPVETPGNLTLPSPLIMSYDIETYSHDIKKFCDGDHPADNIFQISCVFGRLEQDVADWETYILSLNAPDMGVAPHSRVTLLTFATEKKLLLGYAALVNEKKPQLLMGYNTFKFDNAYMLKRAKIHMIYDEFIRQGCTPEKAAVREIKWSSSAYSNQEMFFLDTKGRVHIDLLVLIQRDYKLDNYKLNTVARHFLKREKDPLTHYDIHAFYKQSCAEPRAPSQALGLVAHYCVKDSVLVLELFQHLKLWFSLMSLAKICQVPMPHLFQHGQQLKVFSQIYKYCSDNGIVVENEAYKAGPDDVVNGAYVLDAIPGLYDNAVSFDFASLYPSVIISHNIDYSTLVTDDSVPDEQCHIIEWDEHFGCACAGAAPPKKKQIICKKYRFRWLREPAGILPTIIQNLLSARRAVKAQMKQLEEDSVEYNIANNEQLALKVSANSMYGALATRMGNLPFLVGGMCVTAVGRRSIRRVTEIIEGSFRGKVIYGDTDSNYVTFKNVAIDKLYDYCVSVAEEVSKHFPAPMKLEFENKIYKQYLLLTKKRYLYKALNKPDLEYKGVLLQRRDTPRIIRTIYKDIILAIFNTETESQLESRMLDHLSILLGGGFSAEEFAVSKSVKTIDNFALQPKSALKMQFGSYVVPRLSDDEKKRELQLRKKKAVDDHDFYIKSLPAHVQLALRMRARAQQVDNGSRLSYVCTKRGGYDAAISVKVEEVDFFKMFHSKKFIDRVYYARLLLTPLEELFEAYLGKELKLYFSSLNKTCLAKSIMIDELNQHLQAKTLFSDV